MFPAPVNPDARASFIQAFCWPASEPVVTKGQEDCQRTCGKERETSDSPIVIKDSGKFRKLLDLSLMHIIKGVYRNSEKVTAPPKRLIGVKQNIRHFRPM
ncbi:hypothetical protein NC652_005414 [Populus alba x Populus x berolinensis]|nr:hypothetical protein NC652_005414 [Populus alba x Populus x berolinensis]